MISTPWTELTRNSGATNTCPQASIGTWHRGLRGHNGRRHVVKTSLLLAKIFVQGQEKIRIIHHFLSELCVSNEHLSVFGDPVDSNTLEFFQMELIRQNEYIHSRVKIDLVSEHFEAFFQHWRKLEPNTCSHKIYQIVCRNLDLECFKFYSIFTLFYHLKKIIYLVSVNIFDHISHDFSFGPELVT